MEFSCKENLVLLYGGFIGWLNWGDLVQLKSWVHYYKALGYRTSLLLHKEVLKEDEDLLSYLERLFPGGEFIFYSLEDKCFYGEKRPFKIFHLYGGGFLNEFWGRGCLEVIEEALSYFQPEHYFITGQQVSPAFSPFFKRHSLSFKPEILGVRDRKSEKLLKDLGLSPLFTFDDASPYFKELSEYLKAERELFSPDAQAVGLHLNLSDYVISNEVAFEKARRELKSLFQWIRKKGLKVYFFKAFQKFTNEVKDTLRALDYLFLSFEVPHFEVIDLVSLEINQNWEVLREIFLKTKFRAFFGSSYHLNLFFQFLGIPTYLFNFNPYYTQKREEIIEKEASLLDFISFLEEIRNAQEARLKENLKAREILLERLKNILESEDKIERKWQRTYFGIEEEIPFGERFEVDRWIRRQTETLNYLKGERERLSLELEALKRENEALQRENEALQRERGELKETLERIYRSRGWKVLSFYYKVKWYVLYYTGLLKEEKPERESLGENEALEKKEPLKVEVKDKEESSQALRDLIPVVVKKEDGELKGKRILIVTPDIYGPIKCGGIGTAFYELAKTLVSEGAEVTILYALGYHSENEPIEFWKNFYEKLNINFEPLLFSEVRYDGIPFLRQLSHQVDLWLKEREKDFDLSIFPEWMGLPFYVLSAKNQGLRYKKLPVIVNTHSPELWAYEGNYWLPHVIDFVDRDFMERKSVALSDYVVSPSEYMLKWMREKNWAIPKRERVIPNLFDENLFGKIKRPQEFSEIKRLIFFGRLEPRKGLELFVKALERLPEEKKALLEEVVFLGKPIHTENFDSLSYLEGVKEKISLSFKVLSLQRDEALHYLSQQRDALVVVPSLIENSPYTVLELLNLGIPFIASKVGGIPELIAEENRDKALFEPVPSALAKKLEELIGKKGEKVKPSKTPSQVKREWLDFIKEVLSERDLKKHLAVEEVKEYPFVSVCVVHYEKPHLLRETLESLYRQTYKNFEIVLVDDGSKSKEALEFLNYLESEFRAKGFKVVRQENRYLGAARNRGAKEARGELLLFMDDDNLAKPHMLETFVKAYLHSRAQVYTCFIAPFEDGENPEKSNRMWLPLGEALGSGMFINVFGDANALIEKKVFFEVGGFSEDYGIGYEDFEFFSKVVLKGYRLEVIPEALYYYRVRRDSMLRTIDKFKSEARRVRPYLFMDERGLGVGIGYALKLYLDSLYAKNEGKEDVLWEDEYLKVKEIFKRYWHKRWFKTLTKVAVKVLKGIERL